MDVYEQMFSEFRKSAYRVEALPVYQIEGGEWEEFERYRQGIPIDGFANEEWIRDVRVWKKSGKDIRRIRVLPTTLDQYLRYELEWCFPRNFIAGESISIVSQENYEQLVTPETPGDFWIFDAKHLLKMKYDRTGHYLGDELTQHQHAVNAHLALFSKLESKAIPYTDVLRQIREATLQIRE